MSVFSSSREFREMLSSLTIFGCCLRILAQACTSTEEHCANGSCIPEDHRCNFEPGQCTDGSDEDNCDSWIHRCDFESGTGQWVIDQNADFTWAIHAGPTPTKNTGPSSDHLGSTSAKYLLFESSSRHEGFRARLRSPFLVTAPGKSCKVRYFYHMYGSRHLFNVTVANVLGTQRQVVASKSGNQGNLWHYDSVEVGNIYDFFEIVFEGIRFGYRSDIGLDDISLSRGCLDGSLPSTRTLRLVAGTSSNEGRVEVLHNQTWGSVCSHGFTMTNAKIVCKQLGFAGINAFYNMSAYGQGQGQIWLEITSCSGSEFDISDCQHKGWGSHTCPVDHSLDVGVSCNATGSDIGIIRLVNGDSMNVGILQVWHNNTWGTVCKREFTMATADVVCRQLGYPRAVALRGFVLLPDSFKIWLDSVFCLGNESSINQCQHAAWGKVNDRCDHGLDVGVVCEDDFGPPEGTVRLRGGLTPSVGRVEIYHNYEWGSVCLDTWNLRATRAVCNQLGLYATYTFGAAETSDNLRVWLDDIDCSGNEQSLTECRHNTFGDTGPCETSVNVTCTNTTDNRISTTPLPTSTTTTDMSISTTPLPDMSISTTPLPDMSISTTPLPDMSISTTPLPVGLSGSCVRGRSRVTMSGSRKSGMILSPNFPQSYPSNTTCKWFIVAPKEHAIVLRVVEFHTPPNEGRDVLKVYDGLSETDTRLANWYGKVKGGVEVTTSRGECFLEFVTDHQEAAGGFNVSYTISDMSLPGSTPLPSTVKIAASTSIISPPTSSLSQSPTVLTLPVSTIERVVSGPTRPAENENKKDGASNGDTSRPTPDTILFFLPMLLLTTGNVVSCIMTSWGRTDAGCAGIDSILQVRMPLTV